MPFRLPPILLEGDQPDQPAAPSGPSQKFATGPAPVVPAEPRPAALPETYGTRSLFLAARDPHSLYAHWDISRTELEGHQHLAHSRHLVLRVYENAVSGSPAAQLNLEAGSGSWSVHVPRAETRYLAELGYFSAGGQWQSLVVSGPAATPAETVAADATANPEPSARPPPTPQAAPPSPVGQPASGPGILAASPQSEAATPSQLRTAEEAGRMPAPQEPTAEAGEPPKPTPSLFRPEPVQSGPVPQAAPLVPVASAVEVARAFEPLSEPPASQPGPSAGPGQVLVPLSPAVTSPGSQPSMAGGQHVFWLTVDAELIIYGATEPDAQVAIGGQPIRLRPDGSFSYRLAFPDGVHGLQVKAVSTRGEEREAYLVFNRRTD